MREIPESAITLIKHFEGCRLKAYRDIGGVLTIGYGHTGQEVKDGMEITQDEADMLLEHDIGHFARAVLMLTKQVLTDNQFAALISFTFNLGTGAYQRSTLRQMINRGDMCCVSDQFVRWNKVAGVVSNGLTRRRKAEAKLFST